MERFSKTIDGVRFDFHGFLERDDEVCRVSADGQSFKMTVDQDGSWRIWQQVPAWIKKLEPQLAEAIEETYC